MPTYLEPINLPQWSAGERPQREQFNDAFKKLNNAYSGITTDSIKRAEAAASNAKKSADSAADAVKEAQKIAADAGVEYKIDGDRVGFKRPSETGYNYTDHLTGPVGQTGKKGEPGKPIKIAGTFETLEELNTAFPNGDGDNSYLVNGKIYIYASGKWNETVISAGGSGGSSQSGLSIIPCDSIYDPVNKIHMLTPVYENQSIPTSGMVPVTFIPDADYHAGDKLRFNGQDCDAAYSNTDLAVADGAFRAGIVTSVIFQFVETGGGTDRTCLAILHNGASLYASNAGKLNGLAPEAYIQPQENLIINWNLKNPVNQKNKTNYTETGYCIDMWMGGLVSEATTSYSLNITPDGLVLPPLHYVSQYFEQVTWEGELVTFALLMDGILYTVSWKWNKDAEYELIANFKSLLIRYSGKDKYIQFLSTAASNLILQAAKAEKGAIFTGWPVWNYALELAKCQRYALEMVRNLKGSASIIGSGSALTEQQAVIFIPTPISLRTDPSVRFNGNIKLVLGSDFWSNGINVVSASIQNSSSNGVSIYANVNDGLIPGNWYHLVYMDGEISSFYFNANL